MNASRAAVSTTGTTGAGVGARLIEVCSAVLMGMSILRYPGGKTRLMKHILPYIQASIADHDYAEVMVGGGSVALGVAELYPDKRIVLNDADADVANFWSVVSGQNGTEAFTALCDEVESSRVPTDDKVNGFKYWQKIKGSVTSSLSSLAFRFLFLNKTTFGGQVDASPISGLDQKGWAGSNGRRVYCQYNVDNILDNLRDAHKVLKGRTTVTNKNALEVMATLEEGYLAYIDPPYFAGKANKLYRVQMPRQVHISLAEFLETWDRCWLLSYDNDPEIYRLYRWAKIVPIDAKYSHGPGPSERQREGGMVKVWTKSTELLVLSKRMAIVSSPNVAGPNKEVPGVSTTAAPVVATVPAVPSRVKRHRRTRAEIEAANATANLAVPPVPSVLVDTVAPVFYAWGFHDKQGQVVISAMGSTREKALSLAGLHGIQTVHQFELKLVQRT